MRQEASISSTGQRRVLALAFALAACASFALRAEPAHANNDFQNGFEDQLGRIAANTVVAFGARAVAGGYYPVVVPPPVYYAPVGYAPAYGGYYAPPRKLKVRKVVYYGRPYYAGCGRGCGQRSHGHGGHRGHDWD